MSSDLLSLLVAVQYADSAYPAGAFAHSWGLETAVAERFVRTASDLEQVCAALLRVQAAPCDGVAAARCAALHGVDAAFEAIDRRLSASRPTRETRLASERMGRRLAETAAAAENELWLRKLAELIVAGATPGNAACVLGLLLGKRGVTSEGAAGLVLWSIAQGVLGAAMRLLSISHDDVQRIMVRLRPLIVLLAREAAASDPLQLAGAAPQFEIWSMRHEAGTARLFAS